MIYYFYSSMQLSIELTCEWIYFRMSSERMRQSFVVIQHANRLQVSIFQNFDGIYDVKIKYSIKQKKI